MIFTLLPIICQYHTAWPRISLPGWCIVANFSSLDYALMQSVRYKNTPSIRPVDRSASSCLTQPVCSSLITGIQHPWFSHSKLVSKWQLRKAQSCSIHQNITEKNVKLISIRETSAGVTVLKSCQRCLHVLSEKNSNWLGTSETRVPHLSSTLPLLIHGLTVEPQWDSC